jgi:hypothetical protein
MKHATTIFHADHSTTRPKSAPVVTLALDAPDVTPVAAPVLGRVSAWMLASSIRLTGSNLTRSDLSVRGAWDAGCAYGAVSLYAQRAGA